MKKERWIWMFAWEQSRRGGHYIFEIKPDFETYVPKKALEPGSDVMPEKTQP